MLSCVRMCLTRQVGLLVALVVCAIVSLFLAVTINSSVLAGRSVGCSGSLCDCKSVPCCDDSSVLAGRSVGCSVLVCAFVYLLLAVMIVCTSVRVITFTL